IRPTGRDQLYLLPGDKRTATAWAELLAGGRSSLDLVAETLPDHLQPVGDGRPAGKRRPDVVLIDTGPAVGGLQELAMYAADLVLIPTGCDYLSADAVV